MLDEGWWRGTCRGQTGLFPRNYVEICQQTPAAVVPIQQRELPPLPQEGLVAVAIYDFQASGDDEISFDPGDRVSNIEQLDDGWWKGRTRRGQVGLFPANYVRLLD